MTTEMGQKFTCKHFGGADCSKLSKLPIGMKEESGFVHNINVEPVTFIPGAAHSGNVPGWYTNRPTGVTITTTDFRPCAYPKVECLGARIDELQIRLYFILSVKIMNNIFSLYHYD